MVAGPMSSTALTKRSESRLGNLIPCTQNEIFLPLCVGSACFDENTMRTRRSTPRVLAVTVNARLLIVDDYPILKSPVGPDAFWRRCATSGFSLGFHVRQNDNSAKKAQGIRPAMLKAGCARKAEPVRATSFGGTRSALPARPPISSRGSPTGSLAKRPRLLI